MDGKVLTELIKIAKNTRTQSKGILRLGQCMWNTFESYFYADGTPNQIVKFQKIRGSDKDPFYDDKLIDAFIEEVSKI